MHSILKLINAVKSRRSIHRDSDSWAALFRFVCVCACVESNEIYGMHKNGWCMAKRGTHGHDTNPAETEPKHLFLLLNFRLCGLCYKCGLELVNIAFVKPLFDATNSPKSNYNKYYSLLRATIFCRSGI